MLQQCGNFSRVIFILRRNCRVNSHLRGLSLRRLICRQISGGRTIALWCLYILGSCFKLDPADYTIAKCGDDALRELSSPGKSGICECRLSRIPANACFGPTKMRMQLQEIR